MCQSIHTVVFDLDNTLVDTLAVIVAAFNCAVAPETGRPLSTAEVVAHFGPTEENCIRRAVRTTPPEPAIGAFRARYAEGVKALSPYPGIPDLLRRLRAVGLPLGVCTGKGRWTTRITLEALGLAGVFSVVMTGDDVERNKPDPEPLLTIARRVGCDPQNLVMVGDALADVRAARAAGARGLLVLWGHTDPRPGYHEAAHQEAHAVLRSVADLDRWLEEQGAYRGEETLPGSAAQR